ncbi:MAG TPA: hypothetical protein IGR64_11700, partial [Leptolyngbyaceae cyanobacterium M65_K2018_010]|nr:hypothetical protein [Leptolyngbyaceae cyanobacterium M65_K2018_010]
LGSASLVLINPNGVYFGPEAQLDIRGSFVASTTTGVNFDSGYTFGVADPAAPPLLTLGTPLGLTAWLPSTGNLTSEANLSTGQDLVLSGDTLNVQGTLQAGGNLTLLAADTLSIRDSQTAPFQAIAGNQLTLQGNQTLDIYALNHPASQIAAGGSLVLRSNNPVIGDAHFSAGGQFAVQTLDGLVGDLVSIDDPIILSLGDVILGDYLGASLHILAGGSVSLGEVVITGVGPVETTINPNNFTFIAGTQTPYSILSSVPLSNGTTVVIDGSQQPTLDVRAGIDWTQAPSAGLPIGLVIEPPDAATPTTSGASGSNIVIGSVFMEAPGGRVLITNQYLPNLSLPAGILETPVIEDAFDFTLGPGSDITLDARGEIVLPYISSILSLGDPGGAITLLSQSGINQEFGPDGLSFIASVSVAGTGGNVILSAPNIFLGGDVFTDFFALVGSGKAGDVQITANNLETQLSSIGSSTSGNGDSGNTIVTADAITLNESFMNNFRSPEVIDPDANLGNVGTVTVTANTLRLLQGSQIGTFTLGEGNAGEVTIVAKNLELDGVRVEIGADGQPILQSSSSIFSAVGPGAEGNGGLISIATDTLTIRNSGQIRTSSDGIGNAGSIAIQADAITINGALFFEQFAEPRPDQKPTFPSGIFSEMTPGSEGNGGDIILRTNLLEVTNGGTISASSQSGNAGNITITASSLASFDGLASFANVGQEDRISSASVETLEQATGTGGTLTITTPRLLVTNGARLEATTQGVGQAGDIVLNVVNDLTLSGNNSGVFANTAPGSTGNGGSILIDPARIAIVDGAQISVASAGSGQAGNIVIQGGILTLNRGLISAETLSSAGGNITLTLNDVIILLNNSRISTTAGTALAGGDGGNIDIRTTYLVAQPNGNNDITANAFAGAGGSVLITAQGIFGLTPRSRAELESLLGTSDPVLLDPANLPTSDITAISRGNPDLQGQVVIQSPDIDPSQGIMALPENVVDASRLIAQGCSSGGAVAQEIGSLVVTGRGGLPPSPTDSLGSRQLLIDWLALSAGESGPGAASAAAPPAPRPLPEAQALVRGDDGQVRLVAQAVGPTGQAWMPGLTCAGEPAGD